VLEGRSMPGELEVEAQAAAAEMLQRPNLQPTWLADVIGDSASDVVDASGWGQAAAGGVSVDLQGEIEAAHYLIHGDDQPMGGIGEFSLNAELDYGMPPGYNPGAAWGDWLAYTRDGGAEQVPGPRAHYGPARSDNPYWQPGTVDSVFALGLASMPDGVIHEIDDPALLARWAREGKSPTEALQGIDLMLQRAADLAGPGALERPGGLDHVFQLGEMPSEEAKAVLPQSGAGQQRAAAMEDASVSLELPEELLEEATLAAKEVEGEGEGTSPGGGASRPVAAELDASDVEGAAVAEVGATGDRVPMQGRRGTGSDGDAGGMS